MSAILHGIFYLTGNLHNAYIRSRNATNQVMALEVSPKIFALAKSCPTMITIVNQDNTTADIVSCVVNHGKLIMTQKQQKYQIWFSRSRPQTTVKSNSPILAYGLI